MRPGIWRRICPLDALNRCAVVQVVQGSAASYVSSYRNLELAPIGRWPAAAYLSTLPPSAAPSGPTLLRTPPVDAHVERSVRRVIRWFP
jgi:hypothetical protein